jgi:uncharacterized membrane protein
MNLFASSIFEQLHGGSTHLPIALAIASALFDLCACLIKPGTVRQQLHSAGFYSLLLGTLGAFAAVYSGLILTRWDVGGTGLTWLHHVFVWPAFALLIGLSVWRVIVGTNTPVFRAYLAVMLVAAALVSVAGYWGGEMLLSK